MQYPHAAVNTLLANQNNGDTKNAATCMEGFDASKGSEQDTVSTVVKLKEILDAKGCMDMSTLSKESDYKDPNDNTHKAIVHSGLPEVYLTNDNRWEFKIRLKQLNQNTSILFPHCQKPANWRAKTFYSKSFAGIKIWRILFFGVLIGHLLLWEGSSIFPERTDTKSTV